MKSLMTVILKFFDSIPFSLFQPVGYVYWLQMLSTSLRNGKQLIEYVLHLGSCIETSRVSEPLRAQVENTLKHLKDTIVTYTLNRNDRKIVSGLQDICLKEVNKKRIMVSPL